MPDPVCKLLQIADIKDPKRRKELLCQNCPYDECVLEQEGDVTKSDLPDDMCPRCLSPHSLNEREYGDKGCYQCGHVVYKDKPLSYLHGGGRPRKERENES